MYGTKVQLQQMYILIKTHKFDASQLQTPDEILGSCKVRPIVSCCGSPTEKLGYVCATILAPLLNFIPSHLQHIHKHLETLSSLSEDDLRGLKFFSADVVSLYTNIDVPSCIDDMIEFAAENIKNLDLWGLTLTELHQILDLVLSESFFIYNNRLYKQLQGLFMGCRPAPFGAVNKLYKCERLSVYVDVYYLTHPVRLLLGVYMDDLGSLAGNREEAREMVDRIAEKDPHGLLKWELDFPDSVGQFTPFLDSQIRIDEDGKLHFKYYRKPQKKNITLHFLSHHSMSTKVQTVKNFYSTAKLCSSSDEYVEESRGIVDKLLESNGYSSPRSFIKYKPPKLFTNPLEKTNRVPGTRSDYVNLSLPYISETVSTNIRRYIISHNLPIRVIFKPGVILRDLLCSSRPQDKNRCNNDTCLICPNFVNDKLHCMIMGVVYLIICNICSKAYVGETGRTLHERLGEHRQYANNPKCNSYKDECLAKHYVTCHPDIPADLKFEVLDREMSTVLRKIKEAFYISKIKPELNDKEECKSVERFLI